MAEAFSNARSVGAGLRSRPIGNPNRMVTPAMKPSSIVDVKLTCDLASRTDGETPHTAKVRLPLVIVKADPLPRDVACSATAQSVR
jgi:hypothetical protein